MSGPIVRTGTTPKFWQNWEQVFGNNKKGAKTQKKEAQPKAVKSMKKASAKPAAGKKKVAKKK